jgi:hypothetical protein
MPSLEDIANRFRQKVLSAMRSKRPILSTPRTTFTTLVSASPPPNIVVPLVPFEGQVKAEIGRVVPTISCIHRPSIS